MPNGSDQGCTVHNIAADCRTSQAQLGMRVLFTNHKQALTAGACNAGTGCCGRNVPRALPA